MTAMKLQLAIGFLLGAVLHVAYSRPSGLEICAGKTADVVFVLDASSSIRAFNFHKYVRPFVRDVVNMFDIGPDRHQTRVGVVTYNHNYNPLIDLGRYLTHESLDKALNNIIYTGGSTFSSKALEYVAEDMFKPERGARPDAVSIIILVSDGKSRFPAATRTEAEQARAQGMHIFAIGVGDDVEEAELRAIANYPASQFMFHVKDYRALHSIRRHLAIRTCEVTPTPTTTEKPQGDLDPEAIKYCGGKPADVFFLLDVSSSVWVKNFNTKVLPFVKDMVSIFDVGPSKTRVGVVTFSHEITPVVSLDQYTSRDQLLQALSPRNVEYTGGRTFTSSAIAHIRENGFSPKVARPGVAQVIILITDGISYDPVLTAAEAEKTKREGIYIFSIGVGPQVDFKELRDVSSDPDDRFVFRVTDFNALSSIKNILAIRTCKVQPTLPPPADIAICSMDPSDIYFVFESFSKSIEVRKTFRTAVIRLVQNTFINDRNVRVGAITDPCIGDRDIPFTSLLDFKLQFGSIPVLPKTKLHGLISKLTAKSVATGEATREQVGVIFVDENTTDLLKVVMEARRAHAAGLELYVVAVGNMQTRILDVIGSHPARDHVVVFDSYADMHHLADKLGKKMCR